MIESTISFKVKSLGKKVKFKVKHNLDEYGLNIDAAVMNWTARPTDFSVEHFCEYVKRKDVNIKCEPAKD